MSIRVVPKSEPRDAWQYVPDDRAWMPRWVARTVGWQNNGNDLVLIRSSGKQLINPTDWLIRDLDGDPEWRTDADMRREFDVVVG